MKYLVNLLLFLIIALKSTSQELSIKDCKLTFDNRPANSTLIIITKEELLKVKRLRTNYSWAKIESYIAFPSGCFGGFESKGIQCNSDTISSDLKSIFELMPKNGIIEFDVIVKNRIGVEIPWQKLGVKIK